MPRQIVTTADARDGAPEDDRRRQLLDAALRCFSQFGVARTSIQDVARTAGVSRGTVYRYFEDRELLIEAALEHGTASYFADTAAAMARKATLDEQVATMAETVARTVLVHDTNNHPMADDSELLVHIIADSAGLIRRAASFLAPYVEAAKSRGEVASDLDPEAAGEWLARIIYSFVTVRNSEVVDVLEPKAVARYIQQFAVGGLR